MTTSNMYREQSEEEWDYQACFAWNKYNKYKHFLKKRSNWDNNESNDEWNFTASRITKETEEETYTIQEKSGSHHV